MKTMTSPRSASIEVIREVLTAWAIAFGGGGKVSDAHVSDAVDIFCFLPSGSANGE